MFKVGFLIKVTKITKLTLLYIAHMQVYVLQQTPFTRKNIHKLSNVCNFLIKSFFIAI